MRRYVAAALTLGLVTGVAGCDDDFLVTPPQSVISDVAFWQTPRDFTMAVNGAYRDVIDTDLFFLDGASDQLYSRKDWTRNHAYAMGIQNASSGWSSGVWARLYGGIGRANDVLNQLEATEIDLSPALRTELEAQARFLRGYYYHELLWLFGPVPLYTSVPSIEEARSVSRPDREEVINFVIADLQAAAGGLPASWPPSEAGRATRGAALAFLARAVLYEASWQKYHEGNASRANELFTLAASAAEQVISSGTYRLHPDFGALFTYQGEGSPEVIYDYQHVQGVNGWPAWEWFAPHSMGGITDLQPTREFVDEFRMIDGLTIDESPLYDPEPPVIENGQLVSLGMFANRDPRLYATVIHPGAQFNGVTFNPYPGNPTVDRLDRSNMNNTETGFVMKKYVDPEDVSQRTNSGLNVIRMRYADVLLMYAEAMIELGQWESPSVAAALNQLRDRVGMPDVTLTSQEQAIAMVRNERAVELGLEGLRLADIRRWKIAEDVMPGQPGGMSIWENGRPVQIFATWQRSFQDGRDYVWPIPVGERDLNPNLAQNPGY